MFVDKGLLLSNIMAGQSLMILVVYLLINKARLVPFDCTHESFFLARAHL